MSSRLALQYPNGRTHEVALPNDLSPGEEFQLYGHRWKVVGQAAVPRYASRHHNGERPLLCRQTAGS